MHCRLVGVTAAAAAAAAPHRRRSLRLLQVALRPLSQHPQPLPRCRGPFSSPFSPPFFSSSSSSSSSSSLKLNPSNPPSPAVVQPPALVSAGFSLPDYTKAASGGEDAYFVSPCGSYAGVFDGVGGWRSSGVDAGKYARGLALASLDCIARHHPGGATTTGRGRAGLYRTAAASGPAGAGVVETTGSVVSPMGILTYAYEACHKIIGSSTAVVFAVDNAENNNARGLTPEAHAVLHVANLGDSGLRVFRPSAKPLPPSSDDGGGDDDDDDDDDGGAGRAVPREVAGWELVAASREQFHSFNFPLQIGTRSPDRPSDAQLLAVPVRRGDVIVAVTDGVLDNLFTKAIAAALSRAARGDSAGVPRHYFFGREYGYGPHMDRRRDTEYVQRDGATGEEIGPGGGSADGDDDAAFARLAAETITALSWEVSESSDAHTPFEQHAEMYGLRDFTGGKPDDITVVVSVVQ